MDHSFRKRGLSVGLAGDVYTKPCQESPLPVHCRSGMLAGQACTLGQCTVKCASEQVLLITASGKDAFQWDWLETCTRNHARRVLCLYTAGAYTASVPLTCWGWNSCTAMVRIQGPKPSEGSGQIEAPALPLRPGASARSTWAPCARLFIRFTLVHLHQGK